MTSNPRDVVVLQGERVEFICGSSINESVSWHYRPTSSQTEVRILSGGRLINQFKTKFTAKENGVYKLIINNSSLADGGTYICIENLGFGEKASAELTIIGTIRLSVIAKRILFIIIILR